ncbi:hypothetical protein HRR83_000145 [Exophiala dermatitidis]|uniref:Uncharacterized protein n=1 Tax=Exophiala dermatitidis TaxID=5970 RepID=A0AAN6IYG4_EXODE|nr:hypothetical protein HRR73_002681 [Exophiala dermatitidis]KAJ4527393.1 hypothetical protein HRR74_000146 [Exophiala dermatitidis]KAJ4530955.1 hypothetical protein HRR76_008643 [Exophiala dermatitidis]KAJ4558125.1 hypothetical protein HRR77_000147 [Exophiala dermatitidis]KAJ4589831.1 hypothetical protein HRR82_000232 [Exophiala dermatitidis]
MSSRSIQSPQPPINMLLFLLHAPRPRNARDIVPLNSLDARQFPPSTFAGVLLCGNASIISFPPPRRARMAALDRVGGYVRTLAFVMPHHSDTFLPPLLVPGTLEEVNFNYEPHLVNSRPTSSSSSSSFSSSKYGSSEMNDLLVKQYPPLFHAATDIDTFIRAVSAMSNLRHLHVSCPGQPAGQRYRKDIVDYAIISLRLAVENANLSKLETLTLAPVHPAAILYLRSHLSIGTTPASSRVWRRIKTLNIEMEGFEYGRDKPSDHLKILHSYLQTLPSLERLKFQWIGTKGPFPLALHLEPCASQPNVLDCPNACPKTSTKSPLRPLKFRRLKCMELRNATLDASQASDFIMSHWKVLHEFQFEQCHLRSGTWDDALAPLTRIVGNESWKQKQEEVMDVPIMLSSNEEKKTTDCVEERLWDDIFTRHKSFQTLRKVGMRTKEVLPERVKRLLRSARLGWH